MQTIAERLRLLRGKDSQEAFSAKFSLKQTTWGRYERGEFSPDADTLKRICDVLDIEPKWLLLGTGPRYQLKSVDSVENCSIIEKVCIPRIVPRLLAGTESLQTNCEVLEYIDFSASLVSYKGPVDQMVFINVAGNSMEPAITDGDLALINQNDKELRPGNLFAIGIEDGIFLKIVNSVMGRLYLASYNENYPPVKADISDDCVDTVRILGRCIWTGRNW